MRISRDPAARRRLVALGVAASIALVAGLVAGGGGSGPSGGSGPGDGRETASGGGERQPAAAKPGASGRAGPFARAVDQLSLRQQVGQLLISSFDGTARPDYLRRRLRAGETAGVILFGRNGGDAGQWRRLTASIQAAVPRRPAGPALVVVDQEGGDIRTLPFAGPPVGQALQDTPATVRAYARAAAGQLSEAGVNVNLAPVADVAAAGSSVMAGRAFPGGAAAVAAHTRASIGGMRQAGIAATAKHFPGLGGSAINTDDAPATVPGSLEADLVPFRAAIAAAVPLVMLSHATYPALDEDAIASQSRAITTGLLRDELGFDGVAVTDSMEAQAVLAGADVATAAERSVRAGADLILMTGSASWNEVHPRLLAAARADPALRERIRESAARVLALRSRLAG